MTNYFAFIFLLTLAVGFGCCVDVLPSDIWVKRIIFITLCLLWLFIPILMLGGVK